ncbi:MAG TPA: DUF3108 domain-containing protein [Alphaproteobacteria bacterium]|nr:DUF3108 domain-containing protein [Alphaproteobacteria bacterium]
MRLLPLRIAALASFLHAWAATAPAEAQGDLLLVYDMRYGGVSIMELMARVDLAEGNRQGYSISLQGRTVGLIDALKPMAFTATSQGVSNGHGLQPALYSTTTRKRGKKKALSVDFAPDRTPVARFTPPDDAEEPAPPEILEGSVDPASALLTLIQMVSKTASCSGAGTVEVFDGKKRYDVTFVDLPREMLHKTSYSLYSGEATRCRMDMRPLHGFKPGKRRPLDGTMVWFGKALDGAPPLPVRIETEISLGSVRLELASVRWADQQASR